MNEKEKELFMHTSELFLQNGIKSLTMNDIASKLGISKKTLYTYVSDKNNLVKECISLHINSDECAMHEACDASHNAIEELVSMSKIASEIMSKMHPSILFDLQKYHPEAWALIREFEDHTILELTKANLLKGIEQGIYRKEMNVEIIASLYVSVVQSIFSNISPSNNKYSITEQYFEIFNYHIRGIANNNGIKLINQYLN